MTALAPSERTATLEPAAMRLHLRFGGAVDQEVVWQVLGECYDRLLAQATVTTFLVILAERTAAQRLRALT